MVQFSLFGIPINIQPFFWITLAIIGGGLRADSGAAILQTGLFVIAGFVSVLIHELGHALTARRFGASAAITLQAFGGYAAYAGVRLSRPQRFFITAAGPALQILLGAVVLLALQVLPRISTPFNDFLHIMVWISFVWAILNLLPILPLDGGQMLNTILGEERIKITLWTTIITAAVIGYLGLRFTGSILLPIFMAMFAWQGWQTLRENRWR